MTMRLSQVNSASVSVSTSTPTTSSTTKSGNGTDRGMCSGSKPALTLKTSSSFTHGSNSESAVSGAVSGSSSASASVASRHGWA